MRMKMNRYDEIFNRVDEILGGGPVYLLGAQVGRTKPFGDDEVTKLKEYVETFDGFHSDRGLTRTILVACKSLRKHPILSETFNELADDFRHGSKNNFI